MSTYWVAVLAVTLMAVLQGVTGSWRDAPYDDDSFNTQVRYTDDARLHCNDSRVGSIDYGVTKWILPNLDIVYPGNESCFATLDGMACSRVSDDGLDMEIDLVQDEHFGLYYCEVEDMVSGQEYVVKRGLNYKGAYFGNTWPKYEKAAIWSICWAVIFGVLSGLGGVLYIKKYPTEDDDDEEEEEEAKDHKDPVSKSVYENSGYAHGDDTPGMTELSDRPRTETPTPAAVTVSTVNEEERPTKEPEASTGMPAVEVPHDESTSF